MTGAVLFGYAALLMLVVAPAVERSGWTSSAPRLGIVVWQALSVSLVAAVTFGGLSWAVPITAVGDGLGSAFTACAAEFGRQYTTPVGAVTGLVGAIIATGTLARLGHAMVTERRACSRARRRHRAALSLVATTDVRLGVLVVPAAAPAAYCLPGRGGGCIVVTAGALQELDQDELAAVVAHERAHLAGRHHLVLGAAAVLRRAFPFIRAFRSAHDQCARLAELHADDRATRRIDRATLASAVLAIGAAPAPPATVGVGGSTAAARVERMIAPVGRLGRLRLVLTGCMAALVLVTPLLVVLAPAISTLGQHYCPFPLPAALI